MVNAIATQNEKVLEAKLFYFRKSAKWNCNQTGVFVQSP